MKAKPVLIHKLPAACGTSIVQPYVRSDGVGVLKSSFAEEETYTRYNLQTGVISEDIVDILFPSLGYLGVSFRACNTCLPCLKQMKQSEVLASFGTGADVCYHKLPKHHNQDQLIVFFI